MRKWIAAACAMMLMGAGCEYDKAKTARYLGNASQAEAPAPAPPRARDAAPGKPAHRYIAVRQRITVEAAEADLAKVWDAATTYCEKADCEIVSSSFTAHSGYQAASGSLSVRIAPEDVTGLVAQLGRNARIVERLTGSEDKTDAVIDAEAEIKNLTEFRDRLRTMVAHTGGALKDVLEVNRELVRVQTELDSAVSKRKALAAETEKTAVEITFRARETAAETLSPLSRAWTNAGTVFAESFAALLMIFVALAPWAIVIIPIVWFVVWLIRRRRRMVA